MMVGRGAVGFRALSALGSTAIASAAIAGGACAEADGDVRGGGTTLDAEAPAFTPPTVDGAAPVGPASCFGTDGGAGGTGTTFTDLYRDFFGPTAPSSCSGTGHCHAEPNHSGALASELVCGADQAECHTSMVGGSGLVRPTDAAQPERSALITTLRRQNPDGSVTQGSGMPKTPACFFTTAAIERISTWIRAGAPND